MDKGLTRHPGPTRPRGLTGVMRRGALAALPLVAAALLPAAALQAQTAPPPRGADRAPEAIRTMLGAWDLDIPGASRGCTVTFGAETDAHGRQLRFPATCRRALPLLNTVTGWARAPDGTVQLLDAAGKRVIAFGNGSAERGFTGTGTDGRTYALSSKDHPRAARRPAPSPAEQAATAAQQPTPVDMARTPAPETLPGLYQMMRQQGREACRIVLAPATAGPQTSAPAALAGPCPDTGLTIFDPVAWRYGAGRLALVARKGHSVELIFENAQWRKDPAVGAPLLLRKVQP
ncbi:AprI/Inh family metalloprotease inhibitor [Bosea sp. (in: a-proteobacteria)]|uniref:AprI/Inh family metalloprotease inhibitor n=1 Tax=Bosea sp. (in: a-proteobacteria) TaxID=1871050 RepID=UPI00273349D8|nr:AprI/Inh family metalloprotease inhibitor [Bosea sp. (in: a-proteobacteria)]MDP3408579.1 AprI/Inh family metalloprotease inhibitor [Bosea sp. (in: a-proteobacteria)]